MQEATDAPGGFVRQSYMTHLTGLDQSVQRLQGVFKGGQLVVRIMAVAELAEEVGLPVWPVQLIKVDVVCLQSLEAALDSLVDMLAGEARAASAKMADAAAGVNAELP